MSTTLELINAIASGNSVDIEKHFDYLMTSRIAERLDDMRVEVAKGMFKEEVEELDESADPDIKHRSLYAQTYMKHAKTVHGRKDAQEKAYAAVEKKHGKEAREALAAFHKKNQDSFNEEFEDITPEDLEEFMQTEEFDQLDEISKDHLRSYLDKSMNSYTDENLKLRTAQKAGEDGSKIKKKITNRLQGQMKAYDKIKKA